MKINDQWLREWVNPKLEPGVLAEQLTMAGHEVESLERSHINFSGVIVVSVEAVESHPHADNLKVCKVNCGNDEILEIVCGADNVRKGMHVPLAKINAQLPGGKKITVTEIKGISSHGMLCSEAELGLSDDAEGIMELPVDTSPGQELADILVEKDTVFDISLTPNRGDCLSICGIAREVAILNNFIFEKPQQITVQPTTDVERSIKLDAPEACPHYVGRIIQGVEVNRPAPLWLTEKLRRCGLRSINPVVDVTNFVMLELGQPMHAFDNDKLKGTISVRYAKADEILQLLDQQEVKLTDKTLVIADDKQALAMAGIMGGASTAVTGSSKAIFLESAFFTPRAVLGEARKFGLHTDSSHRFERGVDSQLQRAACERATQLIIDVCGGQPGPIIEATSAQHLPHNPTITLRQSKVADVLGISIATEEITEILQGLGMTVIKEQSGWQVTAPSYRFDIEIEADLIEEIARIYGYNNLPDQPIVSTLQIQPVNTQQHNLEKMAQLLVNRGYQEVITYSFVDEGLQNLVDPENHGIRLANPISADMAMMRTSLWPGLLQALIYNVNRQQERFRSFEYGLVFEKNGDDIHQTPVIGGLIYGNIYKKQWDNNNRKCDLFDLKNDVEGLLATAGQSKYAQFKEITHPVLHPGQSAEIIIENQRVGCMGMLHPAIQKKLELASPVYLFELDFSRFSKQLDVKYQKLSKFPAVKRDIAIVLEENIPVVKILEAIGKMATDVLQNLELFDVYQGEGIDLGKKSLAIGLTFQRTSSTLTDGEVDAKVGEILNMLQNQYGGTLRE